MSRSATILALLVGVPLGACGGGAAIGARVAVVTSPAKHASAAKQDDADEAPSPQPIRPESAEDIQTALVRASNDMQMLHNLIDPEWGVGSYDPGNTGVEHHCDGDEWTTHPGMGFIVRQDDRFACDRGLRRCTVTDPHGGGYVFLFRDGPGDAIWLNVVVHHQRNVPRRRDARGVRNFSEGGAGVCALWRDVDDPNSAPPRRFSIFVAHQTGLVPEVVNDHLCGDEAVAAFRQRIVPYLARNPDLSCTRNPSRCSFVRGDEEVTLYGGEGGLVAAAITRPGMHAHLERDQRRDWDAWLRGVGDHSCESASAPATESGSGGGLGLDDL